MKLKTTVQICIHPIKFKTYIKGTKIFFINNQKIKQTAK